MMTAGASSPTPPLMMRIAASAYRALFPTDTNNLHGQAPVRAGQFRPVGELAHPAAGRRRTVVVLERRTRPLIHRASPSVHGSNSVRPGGRNGGAAGPRQLPRTLPFILDLDPPTLLSPGCPGSEAHTLTPVPCYRAGVCPRCRSTASPCTTNGTARANRSCSFPAWARTSACSAASSPNSRAATRSLRSTTGAPGGRRNRTLPTRFVMMAADSAGLMDALSIERAHVLGMSMGGRIAIELALSHPGRIRKLVLVSTSAAGRGKIVKSWPMRLLTPLQWLPKFQGAHPQPRYAHLRQRQAAVTYDAAGRVAGITAPALILHGRRDRSVPLEMAERLHAGMAGSQLEVFRGGHMFFMPSQQQQFLDRVALFLRGEG